MNIIKFKALLSKNCCPFCENKMEFYDGCLGYEALKCKECKLTVDFNGIHLE